MQPNSNSENNQNQDNSQLPNPQPPKKPLTKNELKAMILICQTKITLQRNKKVALIKSKKEEIKKFLKQNNLEVAKAKMDTIIREEDYITVYDILGPMCEILKEKVTYIMNNNECPPDLKAQIETLIYASFRLEFEDLHKLTEIFSEKYGKQFVENAKNNVSKLVNVNVVDKLEVKIPNETFIILKLKLLIKEFNIDFQFSDDIYIPPNPMDQVPGMPINDFNVQPVINPYDTGFLNNNNNNNNNNDGSFPNPY